MSSDEAECRYCGEKYPGSFIKNNFITDIGRSPDMIIKSIISVNVFFFIFSLVLSSKGITFSVNPLYFLSPDNPSLIILGGSGIIPVERFGAWWSFLAAGYLHGSILHIFFNMMAFIQLFNMTMNFYGISRSFIIYCISGISGFILSYLSGTTLTVGASASICGLIGAAFYYGKSRGGLHGSIVYRQVSGWIISLVLFGLIVPGIDNFGHLGGFLGGIVTGFLLGYSDKKAENLFHRLLGVALAIITIAILGFCAINGFKVLF